MKWAYCFWDRITHKKKNLKQQGDCTEASSEELYNDSIEDVSCESNQEESLSKQKIGDVGERIAAMDGLTVCKKRTISSNLTPKQIEIAENIKAYLDEARYLLMSLRNDMIKVL